MEHYKIVKVSYVGIDIQGNIEASSKFKCYYKESFLCFHWWAAMTTTKMPYDNSTIVSDTEAAFVHLENAERFIHNYHKARHKIGEYTYEIVEKIDLN